KSIYTRVRTFVVFLSLLQLVQVMGSGYNKSALTSIERRYQLTTFRVGILQSCFHIGNLSVILFVSYFGSKWHRPRVIAIGSLIMASSCVISSLPQFFIGDKTRIIFDDNQSNNLMDAEDAMFLCSTRPPTLPSSTDNKKRAVSVRYNSSLYIFIAAGNFLKGVGHAPLHPLGISFIDDYATPANSPVYIGVISALSLLGPAFGFMLGSLTASVWVDIGVGECGLGEYRPTIHPSWVGAWWVGYLAIAFLLMLATFPLFMFSSIDSNNKYTVSCRRSMSAPAIRSNDPAEKVKTEAYFQALIFYVNKPQVLNASIISSDFGLTLKRLLRDAVFLSITTGFVSLTSFLAASITYIAKYMETQFDLTASFANLLHGCVNLPMAVIGNLLGGWLIRRKNLNVQKTLSVIIMGLIMTVVLVGLLFMFGCDEGDIYGLLDGDRYTNVLNILTSRCSKSCGCSDIFAPVCDISTNVTYRSACHAGCRKTDARSGTRIFYDCLCTKPDIGNTTSKLVLGSCEHSPCWKELIIFLILMAAASMSAGLSATPSTLTILRVVEPSEKGFAIGIVFVFTRFLAWIPSPVYVGSGLDAACLVWSSSTEGRDADDQQRCQVYDKRTLRRNFFGLIGLQLLCAVVFYVIALYLVTKKVRREAEMFKTKKSSELI
uniref:Solute carrier organic anion transporter family member n=1 Tax=Ciona savignyi TaxID=51511 RepID=H2ZCF0_CIOSA